MLPFPIVGARPIAHRGGLGQCAEQSRGAQQLGLILPCLPASPYMKYLMELTMLQSYLTRRRWIGFTLTIIIIIIMIITMIIVFSVVALQN